MQVQDDLGTVDVMLKELAANASGDHRHGMVLAHSHPALENLQATVCRSAVEQHVDILLSVVDGSVLQCVHVFHRDVACADAVGVEEVDVLDIVVPHFVGGPEPSEHLVVQPRTALEELFEVVHDHSHSHVLLSELFRGKLGYPRTEDNDGVLQASDIVELGVEHRLDIGEHERVIVFDCKHIILECRTSPLRSST